MRPLCEVGYTKNATDRLAQHRKHEASNYLINLAEAIYELEFGRRF